MRNYLNVMGKLLTAVAQPSEEPIATRADLQDYLLARLDEIEALVRFCALGT